MAPRRRTGVILQLIERQNQLAERIEQRQAHQQEAQEDEFEEGTGVIHGRRRYNLRQLLAEGEGRATPRLAVGVYGACHR